MSFFACSTSAAVNFWMGTSTTARLMARLGLAMAFDCAAATVPARVAPMTSGLSRSFVVTSMWLMSPQVPVPKRSVKSGPNFSRSFCSIK